MTQTHTIQAANRRPPLTAQLHAIGRSATIALYEELALSPKPGLVTMIDNGSHTDMDARTFMRSLLALRSYFPQIAVLGAAGAPFKALEACGQKAEAAMLAATGGVNTHRGAIFTLGLLCATAGSLLARRESLAPQRLRAELLARWGKALQQRTHRTPTLPGGLAARRLGLRSASQEAALGFPTLFDVALPTMAATLQRGGDMAAARLDALFHVMAVLDDANLAHRGGLPGLRLAQAAAQEFIAAGGALSPGAHERAQAVAQSFVARRLSPGGAADMLAATCWLWRVSGTGLFASASAHPPDRNTRST